MACGPTTRLFTLIYYLFLPMQNKSCSALCGAYNSCSQLWTMHSASRSHTSCIEYSIFSGAGWLLSKHWILLQLQFQINFPVIRYLVLIPELLDALKGFWGNPNFKKFKWSRTIEKTMSVPDTIKSKQIVHLHRGLERISYVGEFFVVLYIFIYSTHNMCRD